MVKHYPGRWLLAGSLLTLLLLGLGLRVGSYATDYAFIWKTLRHYDATDPAQLALIELRLPRLLLAWLAGASLALSGYLLQNLVNNPLADPYLLGTASGASLGAIVAYIFFPALTLGGLYLPPLAALAGGLGATLLVVAIGSRRGRLQAAPLLLGGVAVGALAAAVGSLITFLAADQDSLRTVVFWAFGSFERAGWAVLPYPTGILAVSLGLLVFLQKDLNLLLLGEERAQALGLPVVRLRWLMLALVSALTGGVVALCGPVGFVGLVVPHLTRGLLGATGRLNLAFCAVLGGGFLLACDLLARLLHPPAGLPVGLVTALLGVPFFVYLLKKAVS
ncbi:iron chelate uptake ABC transporter family permease subunit [Hymenobacter sp. HMF4947]|uniref:Iron chelate uptake ABC transporter family permease subunit n=1 Tax=Hymenobacter ginkgonis TaxID=2682976 RepID=A0A7K1THE5_9BACT|nr:iron ABC transporter permease [Hymenobacter ginkgonis]MVN77860.1 iron chelate uptake ABC transporter family permease subunit [Hymenobacter ginkgonis]